MNTTPMIRNSHSPSRAYQAFTDAGERVTYMNPIAQVMTGRTLDEARGRPRDDLAASRARDQPAEIV